MRWSGRAAAALVAALAFASVGLSGADATRHAVRSTDPPLSQDQLHDLMQVTSWHITETTDYEFSGNGSGTIGGGPGMWNASETDQWKTSADVTVTGPAGCVYHSDFTQDCVPSSGSGSISEIDDSEEDVSIPLCAPPFDQPPKATDNFTVVGDGAFESNAGEFSIDYSTNPPQAYASLYSDDVPGTHSFTEIPGVNPNPNSCNAGGTSTNATSDDSFVSFSQGSPSISSETGDTQVQVQGDQFVIHDSWTVSQTQTAFARYFQAEIGLQSYPGQGSNTVEWTATAPIPRADVAVTKTGPSKGQAGKNLTYTIGVVNNGPSDANNFSMQDPVPANTTFVSAQQTSGPPFACLLNSFSNTVVCLPDGTGPTRRTLAAGASAGFTVVVAVGADVPKKTKITNTATVSSSVTDPVTTNNSATVKTVIGKGPTGPDVGVTKTGPATVIPGKMATYKLKVANDGSSAMLGVTLSDPLPAGTTFASLTQTSGPAFTCTTPAVGSSGTVSCSIAQLPLMASASFKLVVTIDGDVPDQSTLTNTATVSSDSQDVNPSDDSASVTSTAVVSANISVKKTGPATAVAGGTFAYKLKVANAGPSPAADVELVDPLPAETTFASLKQTGGPTASCQTPAPGDTGTVTCDIATLPVSGSASFQLIVALGPATPPGGTLSNSAQVSSSTNDPDGSNNSSTVQTTVTTSADVSVKKHGPATIASQHSMTYTLTLQQSGPSDAQSVELSDPLPAGTTFMSLTQTSGSAFSCSTPAVGDTGTVDCTIGALSKGDTAKFKLVVKVTAPSGSTISNTATGSTTTSDPNTTNNSSTATTSVT